VPITAGTVRVVLEANASAFTAAIAKAAAVLNVIPSAAGKAGSALEKLSSSIERASKNASKFSALKDFGGQVAVQAGVASAALAGLGAIAVKQASDFEETSNVISVAFGDLGPSVEKWAKDTGDAMGRSTQDMRMFAGTLQAMLAPMAKSRGEAARMSTDLAQLAVDLGSFFNVADDDALAALRSGLSGEAEPLKRFGVLMNENTLQAFALSQGIRTNVKDMDEGSKQALRYAFIMERTKLAQGDAVRTADGFANSLKAMQGALKNAAVSIGQALLPAVTAIVEKITGLVKWFTSLSPTVQKFITYAGVAAGIAAGLVAALGALAVAAGSVASAMSVLAPLATAAFAAISAAALPALIVVAKVVLIVGGLVAIIGIARKAWEEDWGGIREAVAQAWEAIKSATDSGVRAVLGAFFTVVTAPLRLFDLLVGGWEDVLNTMYETAAAGVKKIADALDVLPESVRTSLGIDTGALREVAAQIEAPVDVRQFQFKLDDPEKIADQVMRFPGELKEALGGILSDSLTQEWISGVKDGALEIGSTIKDGALNALGAVGDGLKLILKDMGIDVDSLFASAEQAKKAGGFGTIGAAPGVTEGVDKKAAKKAQQLEEVLEDLRSKLEKAAQGAAPFAAFGTIMGDAARDMDDTRDKLKAVGASAETTAEAMDLIAKTTAFDLVREFNAGATDVRSFNLGLAALVPNLDALGVSLSDVEGQIRPSFSGIGDLLTGRVGEIVDSLGIALGDADKGEITKAIADGLGDLLSGGQLDFGKLSGALGQMIGAGGGLDFFGPILGIGGGAATAGGGAAVAGGAAGAASGGAAGLLGGPMGAVIGAAAGAIVLAAAPMIADALASVAGAIVDAAQAVPRALQEFFGGLAEVTGDQRLTDAVKAAFDPASIGAFLLVGAFTALAVAIAPVAAVLGGALLLAALSLGTLFAGLSVLFLPVTVVLGSLYLGIALLVAFLGTVAAILMAPFVALAAAVLALTAVVTTGAALVLFFAKLATSTKSFAALQDAFAASIDRVVLALEPFFDHFMALAGLFDALVSVVLPLASAFADTEVVARVLFEVAKAGAIVLGVLFVAFGHLAKFLLGMVAGAASAMAGLIDSFGFLQDGINLVSDGFNTAVAYILTGARDFLAGIGMLSEAGAAAFSEAIDAAFARVGTGTAAEDLSAGLRDVAEAAGAMTPDVAAMEEALAAMIDLSFEEADARGRLLAREKDMAEEMLNVPQGFKVAAARFRAIVANDMGGGTVAADVLTPAAAGSGAPITIEEVYITASSMDELVAEVKEAAEKESFRTRGTTGSTDGQRRGRGF
jgi:hypothetical protein